MEYIFDGKVITDKREIVYLQKKIVEAFVERILNYSYGLGESDKYFHLVESFSVDSKVRNYRRYFGLLKFTITLRNGDVKTLEYLDFGANKPLYDRYRISFVDNFNDDRIVSIEADNGYIGYAAFILEGFQYKKFIMKELGF